MNTGFVLSGLLAVVAAILLAPLVRQAAWRWLLTTLALVHGAGSVIVGLVHSAPATPAGTPHLHLLGAYAAILGGNLALLTVGTAVNERWISAGFRRFSAFIGAGGLASGLALVVTRGLPPGLLERGAVDTITIWEVTAGALLAAALMRSPLATRGTTIGDAGLGTSMPS